VKILDAFLLLSAI